MLALFFGSAPAFGSNSGQRAQPGSFTRSSSTAARAIINFDDATGVVSGAGGVLIESADDGSLYHWNATSGLVLVTASPSPVSFGWVGMAAKRLNGGLRVALISFQAKLYYCDNVTASSVGSCSSVIDLSQSSLCTSMPRGRCNPLGLAFDNGGNLWYADPINDMEVELFVADGYTQGTQTLQYPAGVQPYGVFIDPATQTHYVTDESCNGDVFVNHVMTFSVGDPAEGVVVSTKNPSKTKHVYVGDTGECSHTAAHIVDVTDGLGLPGLSAQSDLPGISKSLFFSDYSGYIWKTSDAS